MHLTDCKICVLPLPLHISWSLGYYNLPAHNVFFQKFLIQTSLLRKMSKLTYKSDFISNCHFQDQNCNHDVLWEWGFILTAGPGNLQTCLYSVWATFFLQCWLYILMLAQMGSTRNSSLSGPEIFDFDFDKSTQ